METHHSLEFPEDFPGELYAVKAMAGDHAELEHLKGWQKYYNTYTIIGRRNIAISTYGFIALGVIIYKLKNRNSADKHVAVDAKKH
ncbi:hypothetical protein BV898_07824 [Hypsibius exemplaris]|uniref:Up-regulated during skeletal muscle growth protein 5 n=1 Tax=Hypsibius exemplaris TaxID=2072580 RepID=A0A1W0WSC8_HYPEX|nr:hypothetical protein BV898_07824 [Hypsibius exemplaris]